MIKIAPKRPGSWWAAALVLIAPATLPAQSFYPMRPDDPQAAYATPSAYPIRGDGLADDTDGLQAAINRVQESTRRGIVFLPSGRYRLTKPLLVWSGIRLIGYGPERPVLVLGPNTPGYQEGKGHYLVHFVSERPESADRPVRDANPGTFYSAISNIDVEIGEGNPAAVGVRAHFAQHCFLSHMDFHIGSGRAGVEEVGNLFEDLRFFGGEFGITMHKPSPSWPFALLDTFFEGQREAAIETEEGGLTIVRLHAKNLPTVVRVRPDRAEELWIEDSRFENVSGPALVISDESSARTQINARNVTCSDVSTFAQFRESGRKVAGPAESYHVSDFCHGLQFADADAEPEIKTTIDAKPGERPQETREVSAPRLPPMGTWVNLRSLGAKGDGATDDTDALRRAIDAHPVLYLPSGLYRISDTITLRPDTVLIGLNPITTQIVIDDDTEAFQGAGPPKALIEAPPGGTNVVTGIGIYTNGVNPRAVAVRWMAGAHSMVEDVRFLGGHGTYGSDGRWLHIYNENRTADPDPRRRWDSQYPSLWVTDGGGGIFKNIWTPSPYASAGLYVSNTSTAGRVYALSSEHHVRSEVKLRGVANWRFYALQTEEERGESPRALPLEIQSCHDILVTNGFIYRVDTDAPFDTGIRVTNSRDLEFRGLHVYSPGKLSFDNTIVDQTHRVALRAREVARLRLSGRSDTQPSAADARVSRVAGGFTNIDGLAEAKDGSVLFVDQAQSRIHRWSADEGLSLVTDAIPRPVAVALDRAGNLIVVARAGHVYALPPGGDDDDLRVIEPRPESAASEITFWLPTNRWRDGHDWLSANTRLEPLRFTSPDGSVVIPAPEAFVNLANPGWHRGTVDLARTYALAPVHPGESHYVSDEFGQTTWRFTVQPNGSLAEPHLFAQQGEAGTTVDAKGNVYVCAGQVFVYDHSGAPVDIIRLPERPSAVAFAGKDRSMLTVAARTSLYVIAMGSTGDS